MIHRAPSIKQAKTLSPAMPVFSLLDCPLTADEFDTCNVNFFKSIAEFAGEATLMVSAPKGSKQSKINGFGTVYIGYV